MHKDQKKCEPDGILYSSIPPQRKCKICGKYWYSEDPIPNCSTLTESTKKLKKPFHHPDLRCLRCDLQIASCTCEPLKIHPYASPTKPEPIGEFLGYETYRPGQPLMSPKLDTEEWVGTYFRMFGDIAEWNGSLYVDLKGFIRSEKEKSYEQGKRVRLEDYCKDREDGRHSAYSEILKMVEKEKLGEKWCTETCSTAPFACKHELIDSVLNDLLSKLKERLNKK